MKGVLLILTITCCLFKTNAQITWDGGGGDGQWNTATNWVGDIVPGLADDVLLDNSVVLVTYIVNFPVGAVTISVNALTITPAGTNNITLILPNTNTAIPGLNVTGAGDALILNNRAIFRNSSGAASSPTLDITGTLRINNGGHYTHNTQRAHVSILDHLSAAPGTELGEFEFDDPGGGGISVSLSGRTFGSLIFSSGVIFNTYIASGTSPLNINGNFQIRNNTTLSVSFSADMNINGNYSQSGNSIFNLQSSSNNNTVRIRGNVNAGPTGSIKETGTGFPVLELNGTVNQNFLIQGGILDSVTLRINNPAGVTLITSITLPYNLQLTNGKLNTAFPVRLLTMIDGSTYTGGSSASFVEGPMKKRGDEDFTFPVGKGAIYTPVTLSGGTNSTPTDEFTVEYLRTSPQALYGTNYQSPINHISFVEHWSITRNSGIAKKIITLPVNCQSFALVLASLFVARYDAGLIQWRNEGLGSFTSTLNTCPPYLTGTAVSANTVSAFGVFTLATQDNVIVNPLPVILKSFDAFNVSSKSEIKWELAEYCSKDARFELQFSTDKRNFTTFKTVPGSETSRYYNAEDNSVQTGIVYYRLKITDYDGSVFYSKVVAVIHNSGGLYLTALSPNPALSSAVLSMVSSKQEKIELVIVDLQGRTRLRKRLNISKGNSIQELNLVNLAAGNYIISGISANGKTNSIQFSKL